MTSDAPTILGPDGKPVEPTECEFCKEPVKGWKGYRYHITRCFGLNRAQRRQAIHEFKRWLREERA